jgi:hypothetical protein
MGVIEAPLALIGLVALFGLVVRWQLWWRPSELAPPIEADLAAPYREGLDTAMRLQAVAEGLEQELFAEAVRQIEAEPTKSSTIRYSPRTSTCTSSKN